MKCLVFCVLGVLLPFLIIVIDQPVEAGNYLKRFSHFSGKKKTIGLAQIYVYLLT